MMLAYMPGVKIKSGLKYISRYVKGGRCTRYLPRGAMVRDGMVFSKMTHLGKEVSVNGWLVTSCSETARGHGAWCQWHFEGAIVGYGTSPDR